jgi:DNA-binding CsgD family transcriptional regulator
LIVPLLSLRAGGDQALLAAVAELVSSTTEERAERARVVIAPVLSHDALVLVAPSAESLPVRIAAAIELRRALAAIDWFALAAGAIRPGDGAARVMISDTIAGLRPAAWVASSGGFGVALIVVAKHDLEIGPNQDWTARLVATLIAAHERSRDLAPSPQTFAFSKAIGQERERVRSELATRHAATLSALLKKLRTTKPRESRSTPPGVAMAIDLTSQALLDDAADEREDVSPTQRVIDAFAETEVELWSIARPAGLGLIAGLDGREDVAVPREIARAAAIVSRVGALNAAEHSGVDKLRVRWIVGDESLQVSIHDNGDGFERDDPRMRGEVLQLGRHVAGLAGEVDLDSAPRWGTTVSCQLPVRLPPMAPAAAATDPIADLRPREREVLELIVAGMPNSQIAERLFITTRTVKFHVSNILRKLGVKSRAEVIVLAHNAGASAPAEQQQ